MNNIDKSVALFKALGDKTRLDILRILRQSDSYVELLASTLSLTPGTVSFHLKKLENAGLVSCHRSQFYVIYSLSSDLLDKTLLELIPDTMQLNDDTRYREKIINSFFESGKLTRLPSQLKKREIVCEHIASYFVVGHNYPEKEINKKLLEFHEDYCTLRRALLEFGLFERNNGIYKRIK